MQHEIAQQAEFGGGQVDVGAVQAHALALLVQAQPGGLQLALVGQPMGAAQQAWMRKASSSGWNGLVR